MAIAIRVGGPSAAYLVVPLFGGLAVWLTYLLGARLADARAGVVAAILVAFTPIFMFQSLEPMSDVPATAWWLLAWVLVLSPGGAAALGAGLSVSAALLTRPNLLPLAALLVAVAAATAPRRRRAMLLVAGLIPGCVAVAALNAHWYGDPLRFGYGPLDAFYAWNHFLPNLRRHWTWMIELDASVILLAVAAPLGRPRENDRRGDPRVLRRVDRLLRVLSRLRRVAVLPVSAAWSAADDRAGRGGDRPGNVATAALVAWRRGVPSVHAGCQSKAC